MHRIETVMHPVETVVPRSSSVRPHDASARHIVRDATSCVPTPCFPRNNVSHYCCEPFRVPVRTPGRTWRSFRSTSGGRAAPELWGRFSEDSRRAGCGLFGGASRRRGSRTGSQARIIRTVLGGSSISFGSSSSRLGVEIGLLASRSD